MIFVYKFNKRKGKYMKVYAFVGPSGTGKSHRAQMVAKMKNTEFIIDDALFIKGNKVVCGVSAKKANTKIEAVKKALFSTKGQVEEIRQAIENENPDSILRYTAENGNMTTLYIKKPLYL